MNAQARLRIRRAYSLLGDDVPVNDTSPEDGAAARLDRATLIDNGIFGFENLDIRSRSFALLRSQLLRGFYRAGGRTLAVTSTQMGNGKTYVTANLAASLSRIHPTVLVDLDLRRPSVAGRFGLSVMCGIDDYLDGAATLRDVACGIEGYRLRLCGIREPRPDSAALLGSERLGQLFDEIRALPGEPICIIDTPPALVLDDMMLIARAVDGVLMIVEEGRTKASDLEEAVRLIAPVPIVGSVLNKSLAGLSGSRADYYYSGGE